MRLLSRYREINKRYEVCTCLYDSFFLSLLQQIEQSLQCKSTHISEYPYIHVHTTKAVPYCLNKQSNKNFVFPRKAPLLHMIHTFVKFLSSFYQYTLLKLQNNSSRKPKKQRVCVCVCVCVCGGSIFLVNKLSLICFDSRFLSLLPSRCCIVIPCQITEQFLV
jgi:hypothetical protein